jgi:hypothetical protein
MRSVLCGGALVIDDAQIGTLILSNKSVSIVTTLRDKLPSELTERILHQFSPEKSGDKKEGS